MSLKEMIVNHFEAVLDNQELKDLLTANLESVRARIAKALKKCPDPDREVVLIAVSKKQPLQKIRALNGLGQKHFGENYVQEALFKMEQLENFDIKWHFIGGLQTNKAKFVSGKFALAHSVDSFKLARELNKKAKSLNIVQPVLIQVNLAREKQKYGAARESLPNLARDILDLKNLRLDGLMVMPPYFDDPEKSRPFFAELRRLRQETAQTLGINLPHLSMGMSGDFEAAVEEGATMVRVGTALFGTR